MSDPLRNNPIVDAYLGRRASLEALIRRGRAHYAEAMAERDIIDSHFFRTFLDDLEKLVAVEQEPCPHLLVEVQGPDDERGFCTRCGAVAPVPAPQTPEEPDR